MSYKKLSRNKLLATSLMGQCVEFVFQMVLAVGCWLLAVGIDIIERGKIMGQYRELICFMHISF